MEARASTSSITSGRRLFLPGAGNLRSNVGRRWHALYSSFAAEVGEPRASNPAIDQLIRRLASLCLAAEQAEAASTKTEKPADLRQIVRASSEIRSLLTTLGILSVADTAEDEDLDLLRAQAGLQPQAKIIARKRLRRRPAREDDDE